MSAVLHESIAEIPSPPWEVLTPKKHDERLHEIIEALTNDWVGAPDQIRRAARSYLIRLRQHPRALKMVTARPAHRPGSDSWHPQAIALHYFLASRGDQPRSKATKVAKKVAKGIVATAWGITDAGVAKHSTQWREYAEARWGQLKELNYTRDSVLKALAAEATSFST